MPETSVHHWLAKRIVLIAVALVSLILVIAVTSRIAVQEMLMSVEQSRSMGLAAVGWEARNMWATHGFNMPVDLARTVPLGPSTSRNADLRVRSSSFDGALASLHQVVSAHHGYFDDLRTESHSGQGRLLSVALAVPSPEFDAALSDLKKIGRLVAISEAGEDAAVRLANQARQVAAAQTTLVRLQKLQRERTDKLQAAIALEKEIAQANEHVGEALRQQEELQSTVAFGHISFTLLEDYRAPLQAKLDGEPLHLRNALIEGVGAIFSTVAMVVAVLFEYGLPLLFWLAVLIFPTHLAWRRFHRPSPLPTGAV